MKLLILAAILGCAFAHPSIQTRIIGGTSASIQQYPFAANMQYLFSGSWVQQCGGALITAGNVLSAAHCYSSSTASEWRARLGSASAVSGSIHNVESIVIHPQYDDAAMDGDVALLKLAESAVYSNSVQRVSISGWNYAVPDGSTVTVLGWGITYLNGASADELQHVDIQTINFDICTQRYNERRVFWPSTPELTENMLCVGVLDVGGKDACNGDNGGPVVHFNGNEYVVVGLTSWGAGCGDPYYPRVVTSVASVSQWVIANA